MIIPDNTPKTPLKASAKLPPTGPPLAPEQGTSQPPPPSYGAATSTAPHPTEQAFYQHVRPQPQSAAKRFFKAFFVAVLIWLLLSVLVRSVFDAAHGRHGRWGDPRTDLEVPDGVNLTDCVNGQWSASSTPSHPPYPYHGKASFELPVSAETLLVLSRGALQSGSLHLATSKTVSNSAQVNITVHYFDGNVLTHAKLCEIERKRGEHGIGIFTPRKWWGPGRHTIKDQLYFEIDITLPESKTVPLRLNNFETDLHNYLHHFTYDAGAVQFGSLSLETSNGPVIANDIRVLGLGSVRSSNAIISVDSFLASKGTIRTSNGAIRGTYNATDSLNLRTSNAPIEATVNLENTKGSADLTIKTSNNLIDTKINLLGSEKNQAGRFTVVTSTSNGALKVDVATIPYDSTLSYDGWTSNARAEVALAPSFDGRYSLATSNSKPSVNITDVKDPAERGRQRTVRQLSNKAGFLEGLVYWDDQPKDSRAKIRSSNAPVSLYL